MFRLLIIGFLFFSYNVFAQGECEKDLETDKCKVEKFVSSNLKLEKAPIYAGHIFDEETGLVYSNARYYDPILGMFTSPDPLFTAKPNKCRDSQCNLYSYAINNPLSYKDPTGLVAVKTFRERNNVSRILSRAIRQRSLMDKLFGWGTVRDIISVGTPRSLNFNPVDGRFYSFAARMEGNNVLKLAFGSSDDGLIRNGGHLELAAAIAESDASNLGDFLGGGIKIDRNGDYSITWKSGGLNGGELAAGPRDALINAIEQVMRK